MLTRSAACWRSRSTSIARIGRKKPIRRARSVCCALDSGRRGTLLPVVSREPERIPIRFDRIGGLDLCSAALSSTNRCPRRRKMLACGVAFSSTNRCPLRRKNAGLWCRIFFNEPVPTSPEIAPGPHPDIARPPACSMNRAMSDTPFPVVTLAKTNGLSPRMRRASRSITSRSAPT